MTLKTNSSSNVRCWTNNRFASNSSCWHENLNQSYIHSLIWCWSRLVSNSWCSSWSAPTYRSRCWSEDI